MMKRTYFLLLILFSHAFAVDTPFNSFIKNSVISNLSSLISSNVEIKKVKGPLVTSVVLENFSIKDPSSSGMDLIVVKKLKVNYSLLKFVRTKDILSSIKSVTLEGAIININHFADDSYNLQKLMGANPDQPTPNEAVPLPKVTVFLEECTLVYKDTRGFGVNPLTKAVTNTLSKIDGQIDISEEGITYKIEGSLNKDIAPITLKGEAVDGSFRMDLFADGTDIAPLVNYISPVREITFQRAIGSTELSIFFSPETVKKSNVFPFDLKLSMDIDYGLFKTEWTPPSIMLTAGHAKLTNQGLFFKEVKGTAVGEDFDLNGSIDKFESMSLNVKNNDFDLSHAKEFLPFLKTWNLSGKGNVDLMLLADMQQGFHIKSKLDKMYGNIFSYFVDHANMYLTFRHPNVSFSIPYLSAYEGLGTARGKVWMHPDKAPSLDIDIDLKKARLYKYFKNKHFIGRGDINVGIGHTADQMEGVIFVEGTSAKVFGQDLRSAYIPFTKTPEAMNFNEGSFLNLNDNLSNLYFSGPLYSSDLFKIRVDAPTINLTNLYFVPSKKDSIVVNTSLSGEIKGYYDKAFIQDPIGAMNGIIILNHIGYTATRGVTALNGAGIVSFNQFAFVDVYLANENARITINTKASSFGLKHSDFSFDQFPIAYSYPYINSEKLKFVGLIDGKLRMFPDKNMLIVKRYGFKGAAFLKDANILDKSISTLKTDLFLQKNKLSLRSAEIILNQDILPIKMDLDYRSSKNFSIDFNNSYLSEKSWHTFPQTLKFTAKELNGQFDRQNGQFYSDLDFHVDSLSYQKRHLPQLSGHIGIGKDLISLNNIKAWYQSDQYFVSGNITNFIRNKKNPVVYDLTLSTRKGRIENISNLYKIATGLIKKDDPSAVKDITPTTVLFSKYNHLVGKNYFPLFKKKNTDILSVLAEFKKSKEKYTPQELPKGEGAIRGFIHLINKPYLIVNSDIEVTDGRLFRTTFKSLFFKAKTVLDITQIKFVGENIDVLDNVFSEIRSEATFYAKSSDLVFNDLRTVFKEKRSNNLLSGKVHLGPMLNAGEEAKPNDINLKLNLYQDDINVLSIIHPSIAKLSNKGTIESEIKGSLFAPQISAKIFDIQDLAITFHPDFVLKSPLRIPVANASLIDNRLTLKNTPIFWQGEDTKNVPNEFLVNGSIQTSYTFKEKGVLPVSFDVQVASTNLQISLPDLYEGKVDLGITTIKGLLSVPLSLAEKKKQLNLVLTEKETGPLIKSTAKLHNGNIIIAKRLNKGYKPSFLLHIPTILGDHMAASGKNLGNGASNFVNTLFMDINEDPKKFLVRGSLNTYDLNHQFLLDNGRIIFMGKVFDLFEKNDQRDFYKNNSDLIVDNKVTIKMEPDPDAPSKRKATLFFNLKATSLVNVTQTITADVIASGNEMETVTEKHFFVFNINGSLYSPETYSIDHYLLDDQESYVQQSPRIHLSQISSEELDTITTYLLPDVLKPEFYQQLLSEGLSNDQANELMKNYSVSQINSWIDQQLRPFETEVAKAVGLYDIKIKHNFGKEVVNQLPIFKTDELIDSISEDDDELVSVQYIKDLFLKKLFIKLKTSLDQDPTTQDLNFKFTEYELLWFLNNFMSINYGNRNLQNNIYGVFSINANYDF
jgi:hypothetical protein